MTKQEFIKKYHAAIQEACKGTPIFPSVTLAQAALETGWGRAAIENNMFGVKATGNLTPFWDGKGKLVTTHEVINGKPVVKRCSFRVYATTADSVRDHNYLLLKLDRYKRVRDAKTPEEQCKMLQKCGYATATKYADTLINIIKTNNLTKYDI